ncbi:ATP synthase subunit delta [bacterium HR35]|nr:ATP synthase subunit delta [bacterium HR35]
MTDKVKVLGEAMINLAKKNKWRLIDLFLERIQEEKNPYLLLELKEYLKKRKIQLANYEPAKLFLAFDFDEKKIEELIEKKFKLKIKIEEKKFDKDLILGGKIKTEDFLIDFSLRQLILEIFKD